jgi:radical SAM superfamily enzyme YgiQ (UPF0313 family)
VNNEELRNAIDSLKEGGFKGKDIFVYVMVGLPNHTGEDVKNSIFFVANLGAKVKLVEYSPIPGTKDWKETKYPETIDPLFHNNLAFITKTIGWDLYQKLKNLTRVVNYALDLELDWKDLSKEQGFYF